MHVNAFNVAEFLDLVHHFIIINAKSDEDRVRLNRMLIGPPQVDRPTVVDERTGIVPPSWWKGDDYASQSGLAAMMTLKR